MRKCVIISDGTFTCTTAPLQGTMKEVIPAAAAMGYEAVQLTVNRPEEIDVDELNALLAENGLAVSAIATGRGYTVDGLSMGSGDEENRKAAVERMNGHIDLSAKIGKPSVVIGAIRGWTTDAATKELYMKQFDRSVREVVAYAEEKGVIIILEANDHLETDVYITTKDTADYIREINSPCFKLQLDTMHMFYENEEAYAPVVENADILQQVDISGEAREFPDETKFDYPLLFKALTEIGFKGDLAFEFKQDCVPDAAKAGCEYVSRLIRNAAN